MRLARGPRTSNPWLSLVPQAIMTKDKSPCSPASHWWKHVFLHVRWGLGAVWSGLKLRKFETDFRPLSLHEREGERGWLFLLLKSLKLLFRRTGAQNFSAPLANSTHCGFQKRFVSRFSENSLPFLPSLLLRPPFCCLLKQNCTHTKINFVKFQLRQNF